MGADELGDRRLELVVGAAVLVAGTTLLAELWRQVKQLDAGVQQLWLQGKRVAQNTAAGPLLGETAGLLARLRELPQERS